MYQIGMFSKINHVTTKTLRHYDEIGLLKPKHIDDFTGYRYYSSEQLLKLHEILSLKEMGLGLMEIKNILNDKGNIEEYLVQKKYELMNEIESKKEKLLKINNYLEYDNDKIQPIIKPLPEVIVASMRVTIPNYDTYFDIVPKMGKEMQSKGVVCSKPEYCFTIYHDGEYKETDIDAEVCEAVIDFYEDSETVKYKKIAVVEKAVCLLHKGSYSSLRSSYVKLFKWIDKNGYEVVGLTRESYIDGIWNKENEDEWLTEIQVPISQ